MQAMIKKECSAPGTFKDDIHSLNAETETRDEGRYQGTVVRARADRFCVGESPTKQSLGIEKRYDRRNKITEVEHDGAAARDKNVIETTYLKYYRELFSASLVELNVFRTNLCLACRD